MFSPANTERFQPLQRIRAFNQEVLFEVGGVTKQLLVVSGQGIGIAGSGKPDRPVGFAKSAHSSVRTRTVSPISRNSKNGAHAARKGG